MAWCRPGESHYLNQWLGVYWCIYASLGLNELRPSRAVRDWQVTRKTGEFLGFTDNFRFKLVLKSLQDRQLIPPKTQWHWVLSKMVPSLWQSQTRHTLYISLHWSLDHWTEIWGPQRTWQLCRADPRWSYLWLTGTHYVIPSENFQILWNLSVTTTSMMKFINCDLSSNVL